ncbi:DNA-binding transcriptional ArsR family regulator [Sphingobium sp. OAS761]|uniref:winged helix DNA-binding protein n=1 Tax=Sphingobium sp. OAS761 TaxID=2817901 RepID=UPI00209FC668|nr:winged helix DNA-binding protein [Sphingobium sp. OAS761]MCP1469055.1 DNA-binding transcriptional ArsR family regulator [Sphingobium sp. OAS761]
MIEDFSYSLPFGDPVDAFPARDDRAGMLVVGDGLDPQDLEPVADAAGLRLLGTTRLADAPARLDAQARCDALLLVCPDATPLLERLLVHVETQAIQTGMAVVIVAGWDTMDLVFACSRNPRTILLCDPDRTELAAALIAVGDRTAPVGMVQEIDRESARLQQLSEEVGRLARTIEALTHRSRLAAPSFDLGVRISDRASDYVGMPALAPMGAGRGADTPAMAPAQVRDLLRARRIRADFLPGDLFADPAWDMLLDLLAARLEQERVSVSSLCIAAAVPPTTALRWIRTLTDRGLVERQADPQDGRRVFIALTSDTAEALTRWFIASRRFLTG